MSSNPDTIVSWVQLSHPGLDIRTPYDKGWYNLLDMEVSPELLGGEEGSCGQLLVFYSFREDRRARWEEGEESFAATSVDFSESSVLRCGHHPERPGSIKWFRYMMTGGAVVKSILEPHSWQTVPEAHIGDMDHFLAKYLDGHASFAKDTARTKTKTLFRYLPPEDEYLEKLYQITLESTGFGLA